MSDYPLSETEATILAKSTQAAIISERGFHSSRLRAIKYLSIGVVAALVGAGVGAGQWAYAQVMQKTVHTDELAQAITKSLEASKLKVETGGVVTVEGTVRLEDNQSVKLEQGQAVFVQQQHPMRVEGSVQISVVTPTKKDLKREPREVLNFSVFKSVPFGDGTVMTGWTFATSNQSYPSSQYCYFTQRADEFDISDSVTLAKNGTAVAPPPDRPFDLNAALAKCVWFNK